MLYHQLGAATYADDARQRHAVTPAALVLVELKFLSVGCELGQSFAEDVRVESDWDIQALEPLEPTMPGVPLVMVMM